MAAHLIHAIMDDRKNREGVGYEYRAMGGAGQHAFPQRADLRRCLDGEASRSGGGTKRYGVNDLGR